MGALDEGAVLSTESLAGWREPAALTLDEHGMILDCSDSGEELFGYSRRELVRQHVSRLLPQLYGVALFRDGEPNAMLAFLCRIGHLFQLHSRHDGVIHSELSFVHLSHAGKTTLRVIAHRLARQPA